MEARLLPVAQRWGGGSEHGEETEGFFEPDAMLALKTPSTASRSPSPSEMGRGRSSEVERHYPPDCTFFDTPLIQP